MAPPAGTGHSPVRTAVDNRSTAELQAQQLDQTKAASSQEAQARKTGASDAQGLQKVEKKGLSAQERENLIRTCMPNSEFAQKAKAYDDKKAEIAQLEKDRDAKLQEIENRPFHRVKEANGEKEPVLFGKHRRELSAKIKSEYDGKIAQAQRELADLDKSKEVQTVRQCGITLRVQGHLEGEITFDKVYAALYEKDLYGEEAKANGASQALGEVPPSGGAQASDFAPQGDKLDGQYQEAKDAARQLYADGKYQEAAEAFVKLFKQQGTPGMAFNAAISFDASGQDEKALAYYHQALSGYTKDPKAASDVLEVRSSILQNHAQGKQANTLETLAHAREGEKLFAESRQSIDASHTARLYENAGNDLMAKKYYQAAIGAGDKNDYVRLDEVTKRLVPLKLEGLPPELTRINTVIEIERTVTERDANGKVTSQRVSNHRQLTGNDVFSFGDLKDPLRGTEILLEPGVEYRITFEDLQTRQTETREFKVSQGSSPAAAAPSATSAASTTPLKPDEEKAILIRASNLYNKDKNYPEAAKEFQALSLRTGKALHLYYTGLSYEMVGDDVLAKRFFQASLKVKGLNDETRQKAQRRLMHADERLSLLEIKDLPAELRAPNTKVHIEKTAPSRDAKGNPVVSKTESDFVGSDVFDLDPINPSSASSLILEAAGPTPGQYKVTFEDPKTGHKATRSFKVDQYRTVWFDEAKSGGQASGVTSQPATKKHSPEEIKKIDAEASDHYEKGEEMTKKILDDFRAGKINAEQRQTMVDEMVGLYRQAAEKFELLADETGDLRYRLNAGICRYKSGDVMHSQLHFERLSQDSNLSKEDRLIADTYFKNLQDSKQWRSVAIDLPPQFKRRDVMLKMEDVNQKVPVIESPLPYSVFAIDGIENQKQLIIPQGHWRLTFSTVDSSGKKHQHEVEIETSDAKSTSGIPFITQDWRVSQFKPSTLQEAGEAYDKLMQERAPKQAERERLVRDQGSLDLMRKNQNFSYARRQSFERDYRAKEKRLQELDQEIKVIDGRRIELLGQNPEFKAYLQQGQKRFRLKPEETTFANIKAGDDRGDVESLEFTDKLNADLQ